MAGMLGNELIVEARLGRRTSNALELVIRSGPGDPLAVARQGAGDGKGAKFGTLLGFKNGGVGRHGLTSGDGSRSLVVATVSGGPTEVIENGAVVGVLERGDEATVIRGQGGRELGRIVGDPEGVKLSEMYRLLVTTPTGESLGRLQVILTDGGWSLVDDLVDTWIWWGKAGQAMKLPLMGVSLRLDRPVEPELGDLLLAACVDLAIGLRPYVAEMH